MCVSPWKRFHDGRELLCPCGHCYECIAVHRSTWTARNLIEHLHSASSYFVTLTYSDDYIWKLPYADSLGYFAPDRSHYQLFLKRLRKRYGPGVRYFLCHEYGFHFKRPHYHVILYFPYFVDLKCRDIYDFWTYGIVSVDRLTQARMHYTSKYLNKSYRKVNRKVAEYFSEHGSDFEALDTAQKSFIRYNSFLRMSTRPFIGYQLLEDASMVDYIRKSAFENSCYPPLSVLGQVFPIPRIYVKKIFTDEERILLSRDACDNYFDDLLDKSKEINVTTSKYRKLAVEHSERKLNAIELFQNTKELQYIRDKLFTMFNY